MIFPTTLSPLDSAGCLPSARETASNPTFAILSQFPVIGIHVLLLLPAIQRTNGERRIKWMDLAQETAQDDAADADGASNDLVVDEDVTVPVMGWPRRRRLLRPHRHIARTDMCTHSSEYD